MVAGSDDARHDIDDDLIHRVHPYQPVGISHCLCIRFQQIAGVVLFLPLVLQYRNGVVGCQPVKGFAPYLLHTVVFGAPEQPFFRVQLRKASVHRKYGKYLYLSHNGFLFIVCGEAKKVACNPRYF